MEQKKDSPKEASPEGASSETTVEEEINADDMQINDRDDVVSVEEWSQRKLCSDGTCIGVIGSEGRCKECGLPYDGDASDANPEDEPDIWAEDEDSFFEDEDEMDQESQTELDSEWSQRKLCSDGACIGVIGPDGRCKECGLAYQGSKNRKKK